MKKAIDICLIPAKEIMEDVLEVNKKANANKSTPVKLSTQDRIPHLSLVMGIAQENTIQQIIDITKEITEKHLPVEIFAPELRDNSVQIKRTSELMKLHEELTDAIYPLLNIEQGTDELFDEQHGTKVDEGVFPWINDFKKSAYDNFDPHITAWAPKYEDLSYNKKFSCDKIVLAHLGNFNTVRTILWSNK